MLEAVLVVVQIMVACWIGALIIKGINMLPINKKTNVIAVGITGFLLIAYCLRLIF